MYDEAEDHYIDPPPEIQEYVKLYSSKLDKQEEYLKKIVSTSPSWVMSGYGVKNIEI